MIYEIFDKYYSNYDNINKYYYLIVDLINVLKLNNYIDDIELKNTNEIYYSFYDLNCKKIVFCNDILQSNIYNYNCIKMYSYVLHELIHVYQNKVVDRLKKYDIPEIQLLEKSLKNKKRIYSSILPIHEYQAFYNSNFQLLDYIFAKNNIIDYNNCVNILSNLLYNNYYNEAASFTSPAEQTCKLLNINYEENQFKNNNIDYRIMLGLPVENEEFKKILRNIKRS